MGGSDGPLSTHRDAAGTGLRADSGTGQPWSTGARRNEPVATGHARAPVSGSRTNQNSQGASLNESHGNPWRICGTAIRWLVCLYSRPSRSTLPGASQGCSSYPLLAGVSHPTTGTPPRPGHRKRSSARLPSNGLVSYAPRRAHPGQGDAPVSSRLSTMAGRLSRPAAGRLTGPQSKRAAAPEGTAARSREEPGNDLLSQSARTNIIGAEDLTAVFGMGTGVSLPL
jgi:hypothetical protein